MLPPEPAAPGRGRDAAHHGGRGRAPGRGPRALGDVEHVETIVVGGDGNEDQEAREIRLGAWVGNQRSRAATLTPERVEQLSQVGMRWR
ncbi:helicase associated domain-containing protein [Streptomyces sp. NPDC005055]